MKKITIGIPRALLYYRYQTLWKYFFEGLGCKVIVSDNTTKETLENGKKYSIDESCLSSKIYIGHVYNLIGKCDYIFIPRVENYGKGEKVCVKFNALYDIIKNIFPNEELLDINIEKTKQKISWLNYFKLGLKITKNPYRIMKSYVKACNRQRIYNQEKERKQKINLQTNKQKILIVSHPYNTYDNYIGLPIIKKIKQMNIEIIYADALNHKTARKYAKNLSPTLYWTYSKELIGSIKYYENKVDGIIFLTTFPCGPDSLVNELMIRKINNLPTTNILIDELTASTGLETRLESFVDIIKERRIHNE